MIGYHYTTRETWEQVQHSALCPAPICSREYARFLTGIPALPRDAIWVWKEELSDQQAFIVLTSLAVTHNSFDIVLLAIDYEPDSSASVVYKDDSDGSLRLTCNFSIGHLEIGKLPIDLILDSVPASNITKLWSGDLLTPFYGRHKSESSQELVPA